MAYKFQLGAALLSGSINVADGAISGSAVSDTLAASIVAEIDSGEIPSAKVALADGNVLIGDSNGHAVARTFSGDIGVNNAGAVTIQPNAVEGSMLNSNAAGNGLTYNANALDVQVSGALKLAGDKIGITGSFAGAGLVGLGGADAASSIAIDIGGLPALGGATVAQTDEFLFDDAGTLKKLQFTNLEDSIFGNISSDATVAAGGALTIAADAVTYAKIQNVSATNRILGRDSAGAGVVEEIQPSALRTMINVEDGATADQTAVEIIGLLNSDLGGNFSIGNQASDSLTLAGALVVGGDLTVQGTVTTVDSTTINVSSSFTFEGPADDHETTLAVGIPTQDLQVNLPQFSASAGPATYHLPVLADATTAAAAAVTAAEFSLLDGGSTIGTSALNKDDGFMHNDNGTMKHTKIEKIGDFLAGTALASSNGQLTLDIGGLTAYETTIAQTDEFVFDDAGTLKKVQFTHLEDSVFASVSGDVLVAAGGAATIQANAVEGSMLNNNIVSGLTDIGAAIADTDEMIISDNGTIRRSDFSRLKTYIGSGTTAVNVIGDADATLAAGINAPSANASANRTWTLPASNTLSAGESIVIKAYSNTAARPLTIALVGSQEVDGSSDNFLIESDNAAITLYYVDTDVFVIV